MSLYLLQERWDRDLDVPSHIHLLKAYYSCNEEILKKFLAELEKKKNHNSRKFLLKFFAENSLKTFPTGNVLYYASLHIELGKW